MSDPTTDAPAEPTAGTPTTPSVDPAAFANQLEGLLDRLVPTDDVTVRLVAGERKGQELVLHTALPARRQVRAFRLLRELLERDDVQGKLRTFGDRELDVAMLVDVVAALVTDDEVAEHLGRIFQAAHPDALPEGEHPLDVLALEDLLRAIVPFVARFVRALGTGLQGLLTATATS